jgi:predicted nucleotidyltransferase
VLFGSLAIGDFLNDSDADIVVIFGDERMDFLETISELKKLDDTGYIDFFPYGWKQFSDMLKDFNLLALSRWTPSPVDTPSISETKRYGRGSLTSALGL